MNDKFQHLHQTCERKPHGTRARYVSGCKCLRCRAANSRYSCGAQRRHDAGETGNIISAAAARKHLTKLSSSGIGRRSVSEACDVAQSILHQIKTGKRLRIRASTERKILMVDVGAARGGTLVSGTQAWRLLDRLLERGFSKAQIAKWLGYKSPAIQIKRGRITGRVAANIQRIYELVESGRLRRA